MINSYTQDFNMKLLKRIKEKRAELINLAAKNGLNNRNVVNCSQELDYLIYEIVKFNMNGKPNSRVELRNMDGIH